MSKLMTKIINDISISVIWLRYLIAWLLKLPLYKLTILILLLNFFPWHIDVCYWKCGSGIYTYMNTWYTLLLLVISLFVTSRATIIHHLWCFHQIKQKNETITYPFKFSIVERACMELNRRNIFKMWFCKAWWVFTSVFYFEEFLPILILKH